MGGCHQDLRRSEYQGHGSRVPITNAIQLIRIT